MSSLYVVVNDDVSLHVLDGFVDDFSISYAFELFSGTLTNQVYRTLVPA